MLIGITSVSMCSWQGRSIAAVKRLKASAEKNAARRPFSL